MDMRDPLQQTIRASEEDKGKKEGGNRRPLQEIHNLVNLKHAPIIKSLGALKLANDQGLPEKNKDKNQEEELNKNPNGRAEKKVIIISSDEDEQDVKDNEKIKKKKIILSGKKTNRKKKVHSLSSVLTARSKVACGISTRPRPREQIVNIDTSEIDNELAVVEYVEEIYNYYKLAEDENRVFDYMPTQTQINEKMRMILVDWLVEVHSKFELLPETLYLTIDLVDRYLSRKVVSRKELQLVGIASMLLASKYEEIWAPQVNDFICISDNAYTHEQVLVMEKEILGRLEWNLTVATPYVFLIRFIKASVSSDNELENMAFYLAEIGLMRYQTVVSFCPSLIAASAVYTAMHTLNRTPAWTETLKHYTGYNEEQLQECAKMLVEFQMAVKESKPKGIQRKFSSMERVAVALLPPTKLLG